ncbi:MAG: transcriptional regulator, TetR family [Solirubrobacterales bacterium]|nr:transcriptional regulator, TetR family [Solirubrobacterales bacterium]
MTVMYKSRTASPRLRPGPGGLPRGQVTQIQRSRMLAAAVEAVEEVGYARMTVAQVISRARVSRKTFYDVFIDREDCFLAAFEQALGQARLIAEEAYTGESSWREGVRSALARLLMFMDEEPGLARLCIVEALGAGERVLESRGKVLDELAEIVDRGRAANNATREPPEVTAEGVVGAIFAVLHTRVLESGGQPLTDLLGSLMSMIVLPYLGARAAGRELTRPPVEAPSVGRPRVSRRHKDPLEGLNMRLTYRTVRVLMVIAEHPGASNREIAEGSGIVDQGQISKLLNRLARLKLVENLGEGQEKGAANAWHLTPRGAQVERATRPR